MGINSEVLATAMGEALRCAREAGKNADVPVGAVMLDRDGAIAARSYNRREQEGDPLSHAEIEVIRAAAAVNGSWNLAEFTLVVTLEPCPMCAGAAVSAHVGSIVFGAWDPKMGACGSVWDIPATRISGRIRRSRAASAKMNAPGCSAVFLNSVAHVPGIIPAVQADRSDFTFLCIMPRPDRESNLPYR